MLIDAPKDENDVERFLAAVESDPDFKEVENRLARLSVRRSEESVMSWSVAENQVKGSWTPKRRVIHRKIIRRILSTGEVPPRGRHPHGVLLIGPPGAGKTSTSAAVAERFGVNFVTINADDVKEQLPEYEGWNASALHEESSLLAEESIYDPAVRNRMHLLFDMTGTSTLKMLGFVEDLTGEGYLVHVVLADLPAWKACSRAWSRFKKRAFAPAPPYGRFVPPRYIVEDVDGLPAKTYSELKRHPAVISWHRYNTDVNIGQAPILKESGERTY